MNVTCPECGAEWELSGRRAGRDRDLPRLRRRARSADRQSDHGRPGAGRRRGLGRVDSTRRRPGRVWLREGIDDGDGRRALRTRSGGREVAHGGAGGSRHRLRALPACGRTAAGRPAPDRRRPGGRSPCRRSSSTAIRTGRSPARCWRPAGRSACRRSARASPPPATGSTSPRRWPRTACRGRRRPSARRKTPRWRRSRRWASRRPFCRST